MNMIIDRTSRDVERWKSLRDKGWVDMTPDERREWLGEILPTPAASKGMYTHNDLNRVESAVVSILASFRAAGYETPDLVTKTDWGYRDAISVADMDRYYGNIATVREMILTYPDTPIAPTTKQKLNYKLANDIEKILVDVDHAFNGMKQTWCHAGDIFAGEV